MIDGSEKCYRLLAFELQNSHVCEKRRKSSHVCEKRSNKAGITAFIFPDPIYAVVTFECCLKGSIIFWAALYMVSEFKKFQGAMLKLFETLRTACIEKKKKP